MLHTHNTAVSSTRSSRWPAAVRPLSWQEAAVRAYSQSEQTEIDRLCQELASRILELSGQSIEASAVYVDAATRIAIAGIGGVVFQLRRGALFLVRPCVHCGTGRFESAPIGCGADLGHALAVWQPRCPGCDTDDEDRSHSF